MSSREPWVTGFLLNLLITFLEERYPEAERDIPYGRILSCVEGLESVRDPKGFLRDPGKWIPHRALYDLIAVCERAVGSKDAAYQAAVHYFVSHPRRVPTLLEIIVRILRDVRGVLLHGDSWAGAYTSYLQLQGIPIASDREVVVLAKFDPHVIPRFGSFGLLCGNFEGFTKLYDFVDGACCEPLVFQLTIHQLMGELGGHRVVQQGSKILVVEEESESVVAEAESVPLFTEMIRKGENLPAAEPGIAPEEEGAYRILSAKRREGDRPIGEAVRIVRGGRLRHDGIVLDLKTDWVFGAPYSRLRMTWRERPAPVPPGREEKEMISTLLFAHLDESRRKLRASLDILNTNRNLSQENARLKESLVREHRFGRIVGRSPNMLGLYRLIDTVARTDSTVLISGETGTGKELVARAIHYNGHRKQHPFVALNCAAVVETLLESELFGHEKGAFTGAVQQRRGKFEQAHGGTLFLDEIGEISPAVQAKLLRVLQEREIERVGGTRPIPIDVRIIAATNQDLAALTAAGRFRLDLFYRIHVIPIEIPPLRERVEDVPLLIEHFLKRWEKKLNRVPVLRPDLLRVFVSYPWPGNVRELENVIERMVALSQGEPVFRLAHLPANLLESSGKTVMNDDAVAGAAPGDWVNWPAISETLSVGNSLNEVLGEIERQIVRRAVEHQGGNKSRAARLLQRSYRWLRKVEKGWDAQPMV